MYGYGQDVTTQFQIVDGPLGDALKGLWLDMTGYGYSFPLDTQGADQAGLKSLASQTEAAQRKAGAYGSSIVLCRGYVTRTLNRDKEVVENASGYGLKDSVEAEKLLRGTVTVSGNVVNVTFHPVYGESYVTVRATRSAEGVNEPVVADQTGRPPKNAADFNKVISATSEAMTFTPETAA